MVSLKLQIQEARYFDTTVDFDTKQEIHSAWPIPLSWNVVALFGKPDKEIATRQWMHDLTLDAQSIVNAFGQPRTLEGYQVDRAGYYIGNFILCACRQ